MTVMTRNVLDNFWNFMKFENIEIIFLYTCSFVYARFSKFVCFLPVWSVGPGF